MISEKNEKSKKKDPLDTSSKFKCKMCEFTFGSSSGLKTHIARKHTSYSENVVPIKCDLCGESFKNEKDFKDHMITHTYSKSEFLKFKCYECDFWGPNSHTMKMHFRRLHCESISCGICSYEAKDVEELDMHTTTCERYKCNWCANSFNNIGDIKEHGIKAHEEKNTLYHYYRMGENDKFFAENMYTHKHLFSIQ